MNLPLSEMKSAAETKIDLMQKPFGQGIAAGQRGMEANIGGLNETIIGKERALAGLFSRETLEQQISSTGAKWSDVKGAGLGFMISGGSHEEAFSEAIQNRVRQLQHPENEALFGPANDPAREQMAAKLEQFLQEQIKQGELLRAEIVRLREEFAKGAKRPIPRPCRTCGISMARKIDMSPIGDVLPRFEKT